MKFVQGLVKAAALFLCLSSGADARRFDKKAFAVTPKKADTFSKEIVTAPRGGGDAATKTAVVTGLILALNSGFINGCTLSGLLGDKQATAAVTGGWTNAALGAAAGTDAFKTQMKYILSFLGGSTIASLINPNPVLFDFSPSSFQPQLLVAAGLLAAASKMAQDGNKMYLFLCCIANGIQNSVTSTSTGNLCRTSHYTGISSDMGTFLGQVLRGNKTNLFKLKVFAGLAACFWTGGYISYSVAKDNGAQALMLPAVLYVIMGSGLVQKYLSSA